MKKEKIPVRKTIALVGNPNCGKTTLFNLLTKSNLKVGNWPGVTVERKESRYFADQRVAIVDLPGIYSLSPLSQDEKIADDYLTNEHPDLILNVVDSTNLERNLFLTTQLLELDIPVVVALNMQDEALSKGMDVDAKLLKKTFGCEFFPISAAKNDGVTELMTCCCGDTPLLNRPLSFTDKIEKALKQYSDMNNTATRRILLKKLEENSRKTNGTFSTDISLCRYDFLEKVSAAAIRRFESKTKEVADRKNGKPTITKKSIGKKKNQINNLSVSDKIDKVLTNKWLAFPIFALIMFLVFELSIKTLGGLLSNLINDKFTDWLTAWAQTGLNKANAPEWLTSLLCDGVITGVLSVMGFLPQIMILFGLIALLEASGYMSRVAFIMDRLCNAIGLSGKSFVSMVVGCGCSVPAIMSARTIKNPSERDNTIMLTPFVPCSAKLPLFAYFTSTVFNGSALAATSMYFVGLLSVVIGGLILKTFNRKNTVGETFIMELPPYRLPKPANVLKEMWQRGKSFLLRASTVILSASIVLWFLQKFDYRFTYGVSPDNSILAEMGKLIAPLFRPLGWESWQASVATIAGLAAKETVLSTLKVLGIDGSAFTPLSAYTFMTFNLLASPCISALAASFRELHSFAKGWLAILFQTSYAYLLSFVIYRAGKLYATSTAAFVCTVVCFAAAVTALATVRSLKRKTNPVRSRH